MSLDHALRGRTRYPGLVNDNIKSYSPIPSITGLVGWWDFSDISTMFTDDGVTQVSADSDLIYRINDKSGNNFNAVQTTAAYRPLYKTSVQNNRSAALFDGSNDYFLLPTMGFSGDGSISIFVVHKTINGERAYFGFGIGETSKACVIRTYTSTSYLFYFYFNDLVATVPSLFGNLVQVCALYDSVASSKRVYQNGSLYASQTPNNASWVNSNYCIGKRPYSAGEFMYGHIAEILVYSYALDDADREKVEDYLQSKWDL